MSISMNPLEPLQWIHIIIPTLIQMHHEAKLEIAPVATDGVLLYGGPGGGGHNVTQWSNTVAHLRGEEGPAQCQM